MSRLVNNLIKDGYLKSDLVIDAFSSMNRIEFIPDDLHQQADADIALPIGYGQTISQPRTVAFMMELLDPKRGDTILDCGSGSGWTTAILAYIVGETGHVTALEIIRELCEYGENNLKKFKSINRETYEFHNTSAFKGYPNNAPYDKILVSASTDEVPAALKDQLGVGGKMVLPVNNDIVFIEKISDSDFYTEKFPGFSFVPFIKKQ